MAGFSVNFLYFSFSNNVWFRGTVTRFEFPPLLMHKRYAQFMKHKIYKDFQRLDFHDSLIEEISYSGDWVSIKFEMAFLEDNIENNITDELITGHCKLSFHLADNQKFYRYESEDNYIQIEKPNGFEKYYSLIGTNEIEKHEGANKYYLGGFYELENEYFFLKWEIPYDSGIFEWNYHVLYTDWENGILPEDTKRWR